MKIYLTIILNARSGMSQQLKYLLTTLVGESRKEAACLQYDLFQSQDGDQFVFHEVWTDQDGLDAHNGKLYVKRFLKQSEALLEGPAIKFQVEKLY